jgi:Fuc2NAc and GlcNAc transferase
VPLLLVLLMLASFILTGLIRRYALARNVVDTPNHRSSHSVPTPRGGGLAIVLGFSLTASASVWWLNLDPRFLSVVVAGLLVAGIGFYDDHSHVAAPWRFLIHLLAALLVLWSLGGMPLLLVPVPLRDVLHHSLISMHWLAYPLGALFLVWCINLFNFMDGTDGIAGSEAVFIAASLSAYTYFLDQVTFIWGSVLAAACCGFLGWNWPKARIFMGDVGSGFLGLMLGVLILLSARQAAVLLYCGLILFGVFIVDASYTLIVRFLSGQKWYQAHCSHTYQHAAKRYGHLPVLCVCWLINLGWLLPLSYWVFLHPSHALLVLAIAYLPLLVLAVGFKAGWAQV